MKAKLDDNESDYKSIKIPLFSDGTEWEEVVFELETNLDRIWKHQKELNIVDYLHGTKFFCDQKWKEKADKIIYYILVTAAKRDSFARKQIMAARHVDAVPRVERNEGLKLFEMFNSIFMTQTKHQANLPNAQKNFYQMQMKEGESAKNYIARVDSAVAELALLEEKVSVKSWLYILANGLRAEYGVNKKGVLFSEPGFDNVTDLKANIMKEETIIGIAKPTEKAKDTETANAVFDGICSFCSKKGHKNRIVLHLKSPRKKQQNLNQQKEKGKLNAAINTGAITAKEKDTQRNGAIGNLQSQKVQKEKEKEKRKEKAKAKVKTKVKDEAMETFLQVTTKKVPTTSKTIGMTLKKNNHRNGIKTTIFLSLTHRTVNLHSSIWKIGV